MALGYEQMLPRVIHNQVSHCRLPVPVTSDQCRHQVPQSFSCQEIKRHMEVIHCDCIVNSRISYILHMCICGSVCIAACMWAYWSTVCPCGYKSKMLAIFLYHSPFYYLEKALSLDKKFLICSRLTDQRSLPDRPVPTPHFNVEIIGTHFFVLFYLGHRDSNPYPPIVQ